MKKLTARRQRFVELYVSCLNATKAAKGAGFSAKTAKAAGHRLLTNVDVCAAIHAAQSQRSVRTGITQDRVLQELELLAFSDLTHYEIDDNGHVELAAGAPDGAMRALQSIKRKTTTRTHDDVTTTTHEVELKLWDKPGPLKLAGQHVGLFKELGDKGRPVHTTTKVTFGGRYRPATPEATT